MTRWIENDAEFADVIADVKTAPRYALDTEFLREKTYYPKLALMQLAWGDQLVLIDPLRVDVRPFRSVLEGEGVAVMHAGSQDLEILERECGTAPRQFLDTQIAAAFAGQSQVSLVRLVESVLGIQLSKGDQLADWTRRPLSDRQRQYAAADVAHLLELDQSLRKQLGKRWAWAEQESASMLARDRGAQDPETAWWKIKGSRRLKGKHRKVAQCVAAWRERQAQDKDRPPRFILGDLALQSIVGRPPKNEKDLNDVRGLDGRRTDVRGILGALDRAQQLPDDAVRPAPSPRNDKANPAGVTLAMAWLTQVAKANGIDPAMLATRADISGFVGRRSGRLTESWRFEIAGAELEALLSGERVIRFTEGKLALLAFDATSNGES